MACSHSQPVAVASCLDPVDSPVDFDGSFGSTRCIVSPRAIVGTPNGVRHGSHLRSRPPTADLARLIIRTYDTLWERRHKLVIVNSNAILGVVVSVDLQSSQPADNAVKNVCPKNSNKEEHLDLIKVEVSNWIIRPAVERQVAISRRSIASGLRPRLGAGRRIQNPRVVVAQPRSVPAATSDK